MRLKLQSSLFIALVLCALTAWGAHALAGFRETAPELVAAPLIGVCDFIGTLFLNLLKMIIVPLIVPSIICGMMGIGADRNVGRLGAKTLAYYLSTGVIAIATGLILVNLIGPGHVDEQTARAMVEKAGGAESTLEQVEGVTGRDVLHVFIRMVPANVIGAATNNGQLLGVIFFSMLFGFFIARLPEHLHEIQRKIWESILAVVTMITDWIMTLVPIGVYALVTPILITSGLSSIKPIAWFFLTVLGALGIHLFVSLPLLMKCFGLSPFSHFRAVCPALVTAFSTASSAATLPVTMECVRDGAHVSKRVSSFTLPLGATVNMDGTALYECVVVIFIAQLHQVISGIEISFATQAMVVLLALLTSIGVAGIPRASLAAIVIILGAVGLPLESIAIVLVVDSILDMCRTAVNVFSDTCGAAIIAKTEGEETLYE